MFSGFVTERVRFSTVYCILTTVKLFIAASLSLQSSPHCLAPTGNFHLLIQHSFARLVNTQLLLHHPYHFQIVFLFSACFICYILLFLARPRQKVCSSNGNYILQSRCEQSVCQRGKKNMMRNAGIETGRERRNTACA